MSKIGAVVHGPEIVDLGLARRLLRYLERLGEVTAVLGGTMGRVAIIDAGAENEIKISPRRRPSRSLMDLQASSDILFLINYAKSRESGLAFAAKVADAAALTKPLICIDCGGRFVGFVVGLGAAGTDDHATKISQQVSRDLGLELIKLPQPSKPAFEKGSTRRILEGVQPGELISINGTVVARALESFVEIEAREGRIVGIKGALPKEHILKKLPQVNLAEAIIRSGSIRRTKGRPCGRECKGNRIAIIDHCAEDAFELAEDACLAVTIGDDTTAVAADILFRLGVSVIGIVDGDPDQLISGATMKKGSAVIKVRPGQDDVVGGKLKKIMALEAAGDPLYADELIEMILRLAGNDLISLDRY